LEEDVESTEEDVNGGVNEELETGIGIWDGLSGTSGRDALPTVHVFHS
tara:strand:+ start:585 stop:728 length:144 start_codon:yes stop_codon:yes gene_type:complete